MADADSSLTPEQRLLKIIEQTDGGEAAPGPAGAFGGKKAAKPPHEPINWKEVLSPAAIRAKFEYLRGEAQENLKKRSSQVRLKDINRLLGVLSVVIGLTLLGNAALEVHQVSGNFLAQFDLTQKKMADLLTGKGHDISQLFREEAPRNVFAPYVEHAGGPESKASEVALKLMELSKTLKLTGISYFEGDKDRTFCMIEDVQKNITTFLKQGDSFSGITVKEIKPDSVVLSLGTEEIEIR